MAEGAPWFQGGSPGEGAVLAARGRVGVMRLDTFGNLKARIGRKELTHAP